LPFGFSVNLSGEAGKKVAEFLDSLTAVMMKFVQIVTYYAPIAFFAIFADLVATYGSQITESYARALLLYYPVCFIYIFTAFPIMAYIAPGNSNDTEITAIDPTITAAPTAEPKLIIPKLNVDVPAHFNIANDTATIDNAMNHGVAQFKIPGADALPGQVGNLVISGHSAGDIYSNNQYKFIFSGLERLVDGDLIYINYNSVRYTYKVFKRETVEPTNVAALIYPTDKPLLTLITCTPLGTDRYRLLVTAEQINPTYDKTQAPVVAETKPETTENTNSVLPANERSFFDRVWRWLTGQSN